MTVPLPSSGSTSWYSWASQVDSQGRAAAAAVATSVTADYTGRYGTAGTGTDNRAAIQAALNAATDGGSGGGYYAFNSRRSTTVKLPAGHYVLTAPASGATLTIPTGVTLDLTDATLYFDYPASATANWCGIQIGQYGQLHLGKLYPSGRTILPDATLVYDAVRLVQTDDNSRVIGYADSEIKGWSGGAGIRGVGAWISYIKGLRISEGAYGYVASNVGTGLGYTLSVPDSATARWHTDLRIADCHFVNLSNGPFLGAVQGNTGNINTVDYTGLSLTAGFRGCVFEQCGAPVQVFSAMTATFTDCGFEELGRAGTGMIALDNVDVVTLMGCRVNLHGATVPGPSGNVTAAPDYVITVASTDFITIDGLNLYNSSQASLKLTSARTRQGARLSAIRTGSLGLAAGLIYPSTMLMGPTDGGNSLFQQGNVETAPRYIPLSEWAGVSGQLWLSYFTPPVNTTLSQLAVNSGGTATATATLARLGLFVVNSDGSVTLVARSASDTTIGATTYSEYKRIMDTTGGYPGTYQVVAGLRYAIGFLQVATTPMALKGGTPNGAYSAPILSSYVTGQADIASSYAAASLNIWWQAVYFTGTT